MSCSRPLWRVPFFASQALQSPCYDLDFLQDHFDEYQKEAFIFSHYDYDRAVRMALSPDLVQEIPCGRCFSCRLDYSRTWANRCMMEAAMHSENCFVTLTYDEESVPVIESIDHQKSGCVDFVPTLRKRDLQLFMKRLRKFLGCDRKVRFYACGEYGSKGRPHYHLILFGCNFDDRVLFKTENGFAYYTSNILSELWTFGHHIITDVTWDTCAYTARYVMKKINSFEKEKYLKACAIYGVQPQELDFVVMSRRPGIARPFYEKYHDQIYRYDSVILPGSAEVKPPRYFDNLFDIDNSLDLRDIKDKRIENAIYYKKLIKNVCSLSEEDLRMQREDLLRHQTALFGRKRL